MKAYYLSYDNTGASQQNHTSFFPQAVADLGFRVFTTLISCQIKPPDASSLLADSITEPAVFALEEHIERLLGSAYNLSILDPTETADIIWADKGWLAKETAKALLHFTRTSSCSNASLEARARLVMGEQSFEIFIDEHKRAWPEQHAAKLHSVSVERSLPEHKTTSAAASVFAKKAALAIAADEALLLDREGIVREGAWSNIFWYNKKGELFTVKDKVLPGITRATICKIEECSLCSYTLEELLKNAREIFLTQSTTGVTPVKTIDGHRVGLENQFSDELTTNLREQYKRHVEKFARPLSDYAD